MTSLHVDGTSRSVGAAAARTNGGWLGLYAVQAWTDLRASVRSAQRVIGVAGIPVLLYAMFGLPSASNELPGGTFVGVAMLVSLCAYGVVSLAIFTFGEDVASERGRGWIRTMRATPLPTGGYLAGKVVTALGFGVVIVAAMSVLATVAGNVSLSATEWVWFVLIMLAGVVAFSTLGFAIAFVFRPKLAAGVANLVFLPLSFASGFFFPLSELPDVMSSIAKWLPTFHFGQLAYRTVMPVEDVAEFTGAATQPVVLHVGIVVGSAVVFGVIAVLAARRESVTRRS